MEYKNYVRVSKDLIDLNRIKRVKAEGEAGEKALVIYLFFLSFMEKNVQNDGIHTFHFSRYLSSTDDLLVLLFGYPKEEIKQSIELLQKHGLIYVHPMELNWHEKEEHSDNDPEHGDRD